MSVLRCNIFALDKVSLLFICGILRRSQFFFFFFFGASFRFRVVASPISLLQPSPFLAAAFQFVSGVKIHFQLPFVVIACFLNKAPAGVSRNNWIVTRHGCESHHQLQSKSFEWTGKDLVGSGDRLISYIILSLYGRDRVRARNRERCDKWSRAVVFNLGYAYPRGYAKTAKGVRKI